MWTATGVLLAAALWLAGLVAFWRVLPPAPARLHDGPDTEAIVVLTGGRDRVETGLELLRAGRARNLFVSGVGSGVAVDHLVSRVPPEGLDQPAVELGREATSTMGNAAETAAWMRAHGYRSLRLVTAAYHMPRGLAEFRARMPDALIVPHPIFPTGYDPRRWWAWSSTGRFVLIEYHKYVLSQLRLALVPVFRQTAD